MLTQIKARYTDESTSDSNLSCGTNLSYLNITPGENILDLGCGRGIETIQAALLTGPQGKATGLDVTDAMVKMAYENVHVSGLSNIEFIIGDIENLPFNDEDYHAVFSNCVINHAQNKAKAYSEIFRVLKPGGRFVISDAISKNPLPAAVKEDPEAWAQCFGGAVTEEEYLNSIKSAGFANVDILSRREYVKNGYDFASLTIMAFK